MKVRCIKLLDSRGNPQTQAPWLTVGEVYQVMSVILGTDAKWALRLVGDGLNGLALFRLEEFEIVSAKIPSSWIVTWSSKGVFELTTEPWCQSGFWERYYDKDPEAVRIFENERRKIIEADP